MTITGQSFAPGKHKVRAFSRLDRIFTMVFSRRTCPVSAMLCNHFHFYFHLLPQWFATLGSSIGRWAESEFFQRSRSIAVRLKYGQPPIGVPNFLLVGQDQAEIR